jgi:hypothetical protein
MSECAANNLGHRLLLHAKVDPYGGGVEISRNPVDPRLDSYLGRGSIPIARSRF